ncbi:MAG: LysR family transcriptional regulator [Burkholderiaceae bacterium]
MDIETARTFLEIVSSGSFVAAAERLHITQTAVSARIRGLEQQLGRPLFVRNKAGARLTVEGERFVRHATSLVQNWERARQQVVLPAGREEGLHVGAESSIWDPLLADWLIWMQRECPTVALRADIEAPRRLLDRIDDGSLDLAVLYNPSPRPGLVRELLVEEKLVMVTTDREGQATPERYVHVDWGLEMQLNLQAALPEWSHPPVSISLGPLALSYVLRVGGSGYFRAGIVAPFIERGELFPVPGAPAFSHAACVVYAAQDQRPLLTRAREGFRAVVPKNLRP